MARRRKFDPSWVPDPGTVLDDRYRLDEMVDHGGMGVIMRGEHLRMKRDVAVKLLSPDIADEAGYRARFLREVDLAATIEHPSIVRCYDFGETENGMLYLVMELLDGQSLKGLLEDRVRLSTARVHSIMLQVLDGMAAAHLQSTVHRDLKPSNIYLMTDHRGVEQVKVLDFGLAKSLTADHTTLTRTGAVCGTASYVAPESLVLQEIGPAGDVYAIGLIMLEMLIGRPVCYSRVITQTFLQHLVVPARIPKRIWDTEMGQVIAKALQKHPADRYADAEEMYQALRAIEAPEDFTLGPAELPPLPPDDLDNGLLMKLGNGRYATIDALRELPAPVAWEVDSGAPDDADTLRGIVIDLDRLAEEAAGSTEETEPPIAQVQHTPRLEELEEHRPDLAPTDKVEVVSFPDELVESDESERSAQPLEATAPDDAPPDTERDTMPDPVEPELAAPSTSQWKSSQNSMIYIALALAILTLVILLVS